MDARVRIGALAALAGVSLGVGIPLFDHRALAGTETVVGQVLWVHQQDRAMLVRDAGGDGSLRGKDVVVHLKAGQRIGLGIGTEPLSSLEPGRTVRARVSTRSRHSARWVALVG